MDVGCGSGRWSVLVASNSRVRFLYCIDPSEDALDSAKKNLAGKVNVHLYCTDAENIPVSDDSLDFGYSLGVLHHIPDPEHALTACLRKLRPGAPFPVYFYYAVENRPVWFRVVWKTTDLLRRVISRLPAPAKAVVADTIAFTVYWPLARLAKILNSPNIPLAAYSDRSFYTMRTDALDRFGTRLEHRLRREDLVRMMERAGLERVVPHGPPYWTALGFKKA